MNKGFFLFTILFCIIFHGYGQRIFMANSASSGIKSFIKQNNLQTVDFVYQNNFVTNNKFDALKLEKTINQMFPNKSQSGMAILDWEGVMFDNLTKGGDVFRNAISQFENAIQRAKVLRPNIKWSFYGLPTRNFWSPDDKWRQSNLNLIPLFKLFDFVAPSIYIFYSNEDASYDVQDKYINSNVQLAKKIASIIGKQVYPIVNQRFHPSTKKYANELVPSNLFTHYINKISSNGVAGIIWWQSEDYNYNVSKSSAIFKKDYPVGQDKNKIQDKMFQSYYQDIMKTNGK